MRPLLFSMILLLIASGCGKAPDGLLGKCDEPAPGIISFPGQKLCQDFSYSTSSKNDPRSDALNASKAMCSSASGTWSDGQACSTSLGTMVGYCHVSTTETSGSDTYALTYRAVFGPVYVGATDVLKSWCDSLNVSPVTATWSTTP